MPYNIESPGAAFASAFSGTLNGFNTAKTAQAEAERQAKLDQQEAAYKAAQTAYQQAQVSNEQQRIVLDKNKDTREGQQFDTTQANYRRDKGLDLTPPSAPLNHGHAFTPQQKADNMRAIGNYYLSHNAPDRAKQYLDQATELDTHANQLQTQAIALREQSRKELLTNANVHHWSAEEVQKRQDALDRITIAVAHDQTTLQAAQIHAAATIGAASISAGAHIEGTRITQAGENKRHQNSEDNTNRRFNIGLGHSDHLAGLRKSGTTGSPGFKKSFTVEQQALMIRPAKEAVENNVPFSAVVKRMSELNGIPEEQAKGILINNGVQDNGK